MPRKPKAQPAGDDAPEHDEKGPLEAEQPEDLSDPPAPAEPPPPEPLTIAAAGAVIENPPPAPAPEPPPPAPKAKAPVQRKFQCKRCQHTFMSTQERPDCPQGCRYPFEAKTKYGDYVTTQAVGA